MAKSRKYIKGGGVDDPLKIPKKTWEQLAMEAAGFKYPNDRQKWIEAGRPDPRKGNRTRKYVSGGTTKDACYHKVVSRYGPKTSAYRSGAMAKCRKVGVSNWGEGGKKKK